MPCHHNLDEYLRAYLDQALQGADRKGFLFRSAKGRAGVLSDNPMSQADVYRMIGRRAAAASVATRLGCHSFRATGITEYLRNGGKLEVAPQIADPESARTAGLYDRGGAGASRKAEGVRWSVLSRRCFARWWPSPFLTVSADG